MDKKIIEMLNEEMEADIQFMKNLSPDTEKYSKSTSNLVALHQLINLQERIEIEKDKLEADQKRLEQDIKDQKILKYVGYGVEAGTTLIGMAFLAVWLGKGFKFEETGTFTSSTLKSILPKPKFKFWG